MHLFELKSSVCNPNILPEGRVSKNVDLGPSFYFMSTNFLPFFKVLISTFHKMKTKT